MRVILFLLISMSTLSINSLSAQIEGKVMPHDLKYSYQIEEELATGELSPWNAAQYYTYIGEYRKVSKATTSPIEFGLDTSANNVDYTSIVPINPAAYITNRASSHDIVIISESHIRPQHRIFTKSLLEGLYTQGFRHIAIEALFNDNTDVPPGFYKDASINRRGYPYLIQNCGTYIREREMSNMIREATSIGFTVFGYEGFQNEDIPRDSAAAIQIQERLKEFNIDKLVIHCGFSHAIENPVARRNGFWLAYYLKRILNTDPLTIYQNIFTETGDDNKEYPHYKVLKADKPSIFVDDKNRPVEFFKDFTHFDLLVYHPPTTYINERPHWAYDENDLTYVVPDLNPALFPVIIKAIPYDNDLLAVPVDIIEIEGNDIETPLLLSSGKYRLELLYDKGDIEVRTIEVNR